MQRRHRVRHLLVRGGIAAAAQAMTFTGLYPLVPHAFRAVQRRRKPSRDFGDRPVRIALAEWGMSAALAAIRPAGFLGLPGAGNKGPRPVILVHGYAMNRANFVPLAYRLARAELGPIFGFEYWTLGRIAAGARQLGWFVDEVREATGAAEVDLVGHSMGGVVARYYATLAGGDPYVRNLVTIGSPHTGSDLSRLGLGHGSRELVLGSKLVDHLASAPPPKHARMTLIWSRADALVPGAWQTAIPNAEVILYDDLGHLALLGSRRVAADVIQRLAIR